MTEPREVEVWPCSYSAICSVPGCSRRATTILRPSGGSRSDRERSHFVVSLSPILVPIEMSV